MREIKGSTLIETLYPNSHPKIVGGYKVESWAKRILNKISNPEVEMESDTIVLAKAIIKTKNDIYFPAFLSLCKENNGQIVAAYLISEREEQFDMLPLEFSTQYLSISKEDFFPLRYKTMIKLDFDQIQKNWPDYT